MKQLGLILMLGISLSLSSFAQCDFAFNEVDDFDSTRIIGAHPVAIGNLIPSKFETIDGPKIIEEAKALFMYSVGDSINSFFLTLAIPEYNFLSIEKGYNVLLKLADGEVISLYNVPDKGTFDRSTNMRIYQHTCVIPLNYFYDLTYNKIEQIRVRYASYKHDFELSKSQQEAIQEAMKCVGEAAELYPIKP